MALPGRFSALLAPKRPCIACGCEQPAQPGSQKQPRSLRVLTGDRASARGAGRMAGGQVVHTAPSAGTPHSFPTPTSALAAFPGASGSCSQGSRGRNLLVGGGGRGKGKGGGGRFIWKKASKLKNKKYI